MKAMIKETQLNNEFNESDYCVGVANTGIKKYMSLFYWKIRVSMLLRGRNPSVEILKVDSNSKFGKAIARAQDGGLGK